MSMMRKKSKQSEVFAKKPVKKDHALDERRWGGVVHDIGDREVDAGRKRGLSIIGSLANFGESIDEKLRLAKAIRVEEGVVIGDSGNENCCVSDGGVSLFGFHARYFTKFQKPGWYPKTPMDYAMTEVFAKAMLGHENGKAWFNRKRMFGWHPIKGAK